MGHPGRCPDIDHCDPAVRVRQQEQLRRAIPVTEESKYASRIRASSRRLSYTTSRDSADDQYQPE